MEEIKEERSADETGEHGNAVVVDVDDLWVKYMEAKLFFKSKHCKPSHPFTICRVPRDIRSVDNVAYDPLIVSIGPYHRGNPSLQEMEEVKWRNLNEIRHRAGNNFNKYLKAMKEIEPRARDWYSGNINMGADEFIEMMLLDGLFIIELLLKRCISLTLIPFDEKETIYTICGMFCRVGRDMLLLENQLPFFVLEKLWSVTDVPSCFCLWKSACIFILVYALRFEHKFDFQLLQDIFDEKEKNTKKKENPEMINEDGVHHLLHLIYLLLKPTSLNSTKKSKPTTGSSSESMEPTTGSISESMEPTAGSRSDSMEPSAKLPAFIMKMKMKILSFPPPRCRDCFRSLTGQESQSMECTAKLTAVIEKILPCLFPSKSEDEQAPPQTVIPSAVELNEAGVVFKCVKAKSFLDVKFEQGTMKMPRLMVVDSTKPLLRNFIAYEQCFPDQGDHITSYCSFMDYLVNTPRDVEILKKSAIIENRVGSDEEVALLFNCLGKGIFVSVKDSYLAESFDKVTKHTQQTWPKWRAKLKHDYFSNPWAIISLIAAAFVIFLTSVQTYKAAFP